MSLNKEVKKGRPLMEKYDGGVSFFIRLDLPVIDKAPKNYRKALTAVRDTVISKAMGLKWQKGDKNYKKLTAQLEKNVLDHLEEMIESMSDSERESYRPLFKWLIEYSGMLIESPEANPMVSDTPFFQYFLQKIEFIGNSWYTAQNLVFDSRTGQLLTIEDLLDMTTEHEDAITELMRKEFQKRHPDGTDYDYQVFPSASFEVSKEGLNFYIPTGEVVENQLEYIFLERSVLMPYVKKGSLLEQYWK
ncbi:MAG: hypothetical protein IJ527_04585 [Prevotella sp.]|nr:hypothetical protein [Prevotella sp.]